MNEMKKPDLKAPRCRKGWKTLLTVETLKAFKEKYPEYKNITFSDFKTIIQTFNNNIVHGIIENRNGVELPDGLGYIFMGSCETPKQKNIDFKKSQELGVIVTHRNWDSDNKLLKIFYTNSTAKYPFQNKQLWSFKAVKHFRKRASEAFRDNSSKYVEVESTIKISTMFVKQKRKDYLKNLNPIIPETYNEFNLEI
jgi:hypothetical protein